MSNKVLVIGAVNIDIFANTEEKYVLEDSNLAKITLGFGGVGGNIATNLNTLNLEVSFITAFSSDLLGNMLYNHYQKLGIDTSNAYTSLDSNSSVYLGVLDELNDLYLGLNDMSIIKEMDRTFLQTKHDYINQFEYIVIDNNLAKETLEYLLKTYQNKTLILDAVSAKKVVKLQSLLKYISVLKVNQIELDVLSKEDTTINQINDLLKQGVKELLVTNKQNPVFYASNDYTEKYETIPCNNIVNATGAGDAFISGYIQALINQKPIAERILNANTLANKTLQSTISTIEKSDINVK
ncbi:Pseudouridine kinase [Candidatus Izimaplasma bacterium HR1]|jgi:pseudouridine kinase|uniref:carbohydrate kinase family protein n=1 Tax=Candidatus Izimoplasma sp. HR1 TaxID=1541959 RepID=UPI0004F72873|nr:Pseudouridine kinase [Candidatus Izimaplasma bacterium HR1]